MADGTSRPFGSCAGTGNQTGGLSRSRSPPTFLMMARYLSAVGSAPRHECWGVQGLDRKVTDSHNRYATSSAAMPHTSRDRPDDAWQLAKSPANDLDFIWAMAVTNFTALEVPSSPISSASDAAGDSTPFAQFRSSLRARDLGKIPQLRCHTSFRQQDVVALRAARKR